MQRKVVLTKGEQRGMEVKATLNILLKWLNVKLCFDLGWTVVTTIANDHELDYCARL